MAPSGDLGIDHDRGPLPAPSEPYGASTTLGFTLHPILPELMSVFRSSWALCQAVS